MKKIPLPDTMDMPEPGDIIMASGQRACTPAGTMYLVYRTTDNSIGINCCHGNHSLANESHDKKSRIVGYFKVIWPQGG
jgi:hypothetical protein